MSTTERRPYERADLPAMATSARTDPFSRKVHECQVCGKPGYSDEMVHSRHTGARYCRTHPSDHVGDAS